MHASMLKNHHEMYILQKLIAVLQEKLNKTKIKTTTNINGQKKK